MPENSFPIVVRGAALLLLVALAGVSLALQEMRFVLAAVAICCLVEIAIALRARRNRLAVPRDRSRFTAAQVSCSEKDGALSVALVEDDQAHGSASYLLLSRKLRPQGPVASEEDRPYLELSDRKCSVHGGIEDAYLLPQSLCLTLDARAAGVLGASQVCVTLGTAHDQRRLERALGRILRGVAFVSERSMPEDVPDLAK
jgi:hypothetical protein